LALSRGRVALPTTVRHASIALVTVHVVAAAAAGGGTDAWLAAGSTLLLVVLALAVYARASSGDAVTLGIGFLTGTVAQGAVAAMQATFTGGRASGTTFHPNILGSVAAAGTTLALAELVATDPRLPRWLTWLALVAGVVALVASGSRGGLAAAAAGGATVIAMAVTARMRTARPIRATSLAQPLAVMLVAAVAAGALLAAPTVARLADLQAPLDPEGREVLWRASLDLVRERPWLGHGPGTWATAVAAHQPNVRTFASPHPHNQHLLWMTEVGALGWAVWCWWWIALLVGGVRDPRRRAAVLGLAAVVMTHGWVEPILSNTALVIPLAAWWITAGAADA
jgi:O-antigen ligase